MYGKGVLVRRYVRGQPIKVRVELTANHMGYFEFRICPNNNPAQVASQRCLDQNLLKKTSGGGPRFVSNQKREIWQPRMVFFLLVGTWLVQVIRFLRCTTSFRQISHANSASFSGDTSQEITGVSCIQTDKDFQERLDQITLGLGVV